MEQSWTPASLLHTHAHPPLHSRLVGISHERGWLELSSSRVSKCTHFLHQLSSEVPAIPKHAAPSQYGWDTRCKATRVAWSEQCGVGLLPSLHHPHCTSQVCLHARACKAQSSPCPCPGVRFKPLARDSCSCAGKGFAGCFCGWQCLCRRWFYK